jgi:hypothetical protein
MAREERRMVYGLERDGRTVHCSSFAVVSVLRAMGWTLSDSGHWGQPDPRELKRFEAASGVSTGIRDGMHFLHRTAHRKARA